MSNTAQVTFFGSPFEKHRLHVVKKYLPCAHVGMVSNKCIYIVKSDDGYYLRDNHGDLIDVQNQRGVGYLNGRLCQFELIT